MQVLASVALSVNTALSRTLLTAGFFGEFFHLFFLDACFEELVDTLALVTLMNPALATLKIGVGSAFSKRCEYGIASDLILGVFEALSADLDEVPLIMLMFDISICEGGIQGARRWMRPFICCGILSAVAKA